MDIQKIGFGDFCTIEQKRYVGPNEFYSYKVVGRKKSNVWTDVPVDANNEKETLHDHLDDVVTVVCNNLDDRTVHQFRVSDLASVRKAQAVPEVSASIAVHQSIIDEIKTEIDEGYDLCQDSYLLDVLVERGIEIGKIQAVPEGFVLVEKTKLMQIIGSAAIIEPITRGNPLMSKYKTELDFILSTVRAMIEAREQKG